MEMIYRLSVKSDVDILVQFGTPSININSAEVSWEISPEGKLKSVVLRIPDQPLRFDDRGVILSTYPELESHAYRLSVYIANCLFKQTGFDAIDPETVLLGTPELRAERAEEENILAQRRRTVGSARRVSYSVHGRFEPDEYPTLFKHSAALALYTDGLRVTSTFQKFELSYKVIEYFFPQEGKALDNAVATHALPFDARFNRSQIETLRHLRNRITHPRAHRGHINPETLDAIREVRANLSLVQQLAKLLLQHPTF